MDLSFDNRFRHELPGDPEHDVFGRQVHGACWSPVHPTPVADPKLLAYSGEMAEELGLSEEDCLSGRFAQVFGGNERLEGMEPFASCYGGHQFGNWAGQLGDGRAITLGEVVNPQGSRWEIQLKGAGPTPYSRSADGRAVLRSSVREFLCSEAMAHLGVPTTRALSLVETGEPVLRDMFYDGHLKHEPGAIVCRMAPSFLRFGNFELLTYRGDLGLLEKLALFALGRDFPHLGDPARELIPAWLTEVAHRTAVLMVHWMRVGFVHGVMNTDNMSILGLTIDYGPYGWLEGFDPTWTPNTTDAYGRRYAFGQQPNIGAWNLQCLVQALYPLIEDTGVCQAILDTYVDAFQGGHAQMLANKLGLPAFDPEDDDTLVAPLFRLLQRRETDMTIFYRRLALVPTCEETADEALLEPLRDAYYQDTAYTREDREATVRWLRTYTARLRREGEPDAARRTRMDAVNPKYVLRNYLAQEAIDAAEQGDPTAIHTLLEVLRAPYSEQPEYERFAARRPEWARNRPGCSMLSCSS